MTCSVCSGGHRNDSALSKRARGTAAYKPFNSIRNFRTATVRLVPGPAPGWLGLNTITHKVSVVPMVVDISRSDSMLSVSSDPEFLRNSFKAVDSAHTAQVVQWYPGHIAAAERQLKEQLQMVDVVLEIRDARIPVSTFHPAVPSWVGSKPNLLVFNRVDMISPENKKLWAEYFTSTDRKVFWTDGKQGDGVKKLTSAMQAVGRTINKKRESRGLLPRPVRACVIGFPNIGKSALINRLLNRKAVQSAPKVGVTRVLQWVRLSDELDLLDAPGIIPANFRDQTAAQRLAMCDDIGEAAYIKSAIAASFILRCRELPHNRKVLERIKQRYGIQPRAGTGEDFVVAVAEKYNYFGDLEKAGARILKDFRTGALGSFALELPQDLERSGQKW